MLFRSAAIAACLAAVLPAQKKPVSVEIAAGYTGAVMPARVEWRPDSREFAWIEGGRLRIYSVESRSERVVAETQPMADAAAAPREPEAFGWTNRNVREKTLQWAPDGRRLLVLQKGDLFAVDSVSGQWKQLTRTSEEEHDPKLSPDGRHVSFRRGHNLFTMDLASARSHRLTTDGSATRGNGELDWVYPEELSLRTAHWWSPDSRSVAYLQFDTSGVLVYPHADLLKLRPVAEPQRYPQAGTPNPAVRLGVVGAQGGKTRWLPLPHAGDALIGRVQWLPGGEHLAVHLLTRRQDHLRLLRVPASGDAPVPVLELRDPHWLNLRDDYRFHSSGESLLFGYDTAEGRSLDWLALKGGSRTPAIAGAFEVTDLACVDEARQQIFYASTQPTPVERHLWAAGFDGEGKRRLSSEPGWHDVSFAPDCSRYLDTFSSLTEPPRITLRDTAGALLAAFRGPAGNAEDLDIQPTELRTFRGADGTLFHARLLRPAGFNPARKYPAVVMVYGGPHAQRVRNQWRGADWDQALAHRGFVVWEMDNRGTAGRGHAWETKLFRRFGQQELADQLEGVKHLVSLGFVDPARLGVHGWSYGGFMTLYSLLQAPDTFRAGIAGAPVTDWRQYDTIYTERYLGLPQENEDGYKLSSPVHLASQLKGRLMLAHNLEDDNVLFQHLLRMNDAMQREGKLFELLLYPQKSHGVSGPARRQMLESMTDFLERSLK